MKTIQFIILTLMLLLTPSVSAHNIHNKQINDHYFMVTYDKATHALIIHKGLRQTFPNVDKYKVFLDKNWKVMSITKNSKNISLRIVQMYMLTRKDVSYFIFGDHGEYIKIK